MKTLTEYLIDILCSSHIYEMAENQKECERIVASECRNILENLTLINYFRISELYTTNIGHWKKELTSSLYNASDFKVKKDTSIGRRYRIVRRAFDEKDMKDYDRVFRRVETKFLEEKETQYPDMSDTEGWIDEAIICTINQIDDVVDVIAKNDSLEIKKFVNNL